MVSAANDGGLMVPTEMGKTIAKVIAKHGPALLDDRRKLLGLLRDYAPQEVRGVKLLLASYDQGSPQAFLASGSAPQRLVIDQQINALVANAGLQNDLAKWATEAWSAGLYGAGVQLPAPPVAASEDDLTWGSEVVTPAPAVAVAVAAPLAMAPSAGATPQAASAPARKVQVKTEGNVKRFAIIGAGVAILGLITWGVIQKMDIDPSEFIPQRNGGGNVPQTGDAPAPAPAPAAAPQPPSQAAGGDPVRSDGTPWLLTTKDPDHKNWPIFNGATHPGGNPRDWTFSFNTRVSSGHLALYEVNVSLNPDLKAGTGYMRGLDLSEPDTNKFSQSPTVDVQRAWDDPSKDFEIWVSPGEWDKNPTNIPNVCVQFGAGNTAKKYEPGSSGFCAYEVNGDKCDTLLGCGNVVP